jgi:acyl dehydratase
VADWTRQRTWEEVVEGEELPSLTFPLSVYRLIVAAAGTRDFNAIHHNPAVAQRSGAPDIYANTMFLQGMWERAVREYIGLGGTIRRIGGFRMRVFNTVGDTVVVRGRVKRKWREDATGLLDLEVWSENAGGVSVGPGVVTATLPLARRGIYYIPRDRVV